MAFAPTIRKGPTRKAPRILIIGVEGVGKSTAGASMPAPIFLCGEDGLVGPQFADTPSYSPKTWQDVLQFADWIAKEQHDYRTLVIDTLDWIEPMLATHIVEAAKKPDIRNIEDFGFGKGYVLAAAEFRQLLSRLELVQARGINVVILAHSQIKAYNNPAGENYDRFEPKVSKQVSGLVKEWSDIVLFAHFNAYAEKDGGKVKGKGGTLRIVETVHSAAWDAKNRYGLPETMILDMPRIMEAIDANMNSANLLSQVTALIPTLPEDKQAMTLVWLATTPTQIQLAAFLNKVRQEAN